MKHPRELIRAAVDRSAPSRRIGTGRARPNDRPMRYRPATTFADEASGPPKFTSDYCCHLPSRWDIIYTPAQFSYKLDGTGADGARSEGGKRIILDKSASRPSSPGGPRVSAGLLVLYYYLILRSSLAWPWRL